MLGSTTPTPWNLDLLQTDRWYLERRIYIVVGAQRNPGRTCVWTCRSLGRC